MKKLLNYFEKHELILWTSSLIVITTSFIIFDKNNYLVLLASIIGVTSLIFSAKGNPIGQFLMVIFSVLYGIISFKFSYFGEVVTYIGMTMPMAFFAFISWMKNPYSESKAEVKVNHLTRHEWWFMFILTGIVTVIFYFILSFFNTANIIPSTISVTTSFAAVYLTFRRSYYYAIGYALNDIILIILWILATIDNISYLSVVVCFIVFLINDIYGYINWKSMCRRQSDIGNATIY